MAKDVTDVFPRTMLDYEYALLSSDRALPVPCFLPNGNFVPISTAVNGANNVIVVSTKRNEEYRILCTLATAEGVIDDSGNSIPVHMTGRFLRNGEFMPDKDTISMMLAAIPETYSSSATDPTVDSARVLSNVLYDNNYWGDIAVDLMSIVPELVPPSIPRQCLAERLAQEINRRIDMHEDIFLPSRERWKKEGTEGGIMSGLDP
ncbi:hypothetical protein Pcinc_000585 [Petrolisthes cinctipes]|uniref:Uncharacterized protein n=1 Tax=Petrolisthes cinctipes TaxID=88211 RepID=A0AAE1GN96_PETCI|nr:hypothetical protein Pcinc_000585 [Petrolisthes cinctipes]